jgi:hypothetical protein
MGTTDQEPRVRGGNGMVMRIVTLMVAGLVAFGGPTAVVLADDGARQREREAFIRRDDDDDAELAVVERDDDTGDSDGDDSASFTSGVDSNDGTNSRHTAVSRDRDRSRGDLTRDRTKDGPGGPTRDRTRNQTNDRTRNDSR